MEDNIIIKCGGVEYNQSKAVLIKNSKYFEGYFNFNTNRNEEMIDLDTDLEGLGLDLFYVPILLQHWNDDNVEWNMICRHAPMYREYSRIEQYFCAIFPTCAPKSMSMRIVLSNGFKCLYIGAGRFDLTATNINQRLGTELIQSIHRHKWEVRITFNGDMEPMTILASHDDIIVDLNFLYQMI